MRSHKRHFIILNLLAFVAFILLLWSWSQNNNNQQNEKENEMNEKNKKSLFDVRIVERSDLMMKKEEEKSNGEQIGAVNFLIDLKCMENLENFLPCLGPLKIATTSTKKFQTNAMESVYRVRRQNSNQDYMLLESMDDGDGNVMKRALPSTLLFNLTLIPMVNQPAQLLMVPLDFIAFRLYWSRSQFLQCLNLPMKRQTHERLIPLQKVKLFKKVLDFVERRDSTAFLMSGSLLGWYRECTIIPHTHDLDLAIKIEDLSENLMEQIQKQFKMRHKLGYYNESLELSFYGDDDGPPIDLFTMYKANETHDYFAVFDFFKTSADQCLYPSIDKLCSGDLHGHLIRVPCNVEAVLRAEYGPHWHIDVPTESYNYLNTYNIQHFRKYTHEEFNKIFVKFGSESAEPVEKIQVEDGTDGNESGNGLKRVYKNEDTTKEPEQYVPLFNFKINGSNPKLNEDVAVRDSNPFMTKEEEENGDVRGNERKGMVKDQEESGVLNGGRGMVKNQEESRVLNGGEMVKDQEESRVLVNRGGMIKEQDESIKNPEAAVRNQEQLVKDQKEVVKDQEESEAQNNGRIIKNQEEAVKDPEDKIKNPEETVRNPKEAFRNQEEQVKNPGEPAKNQKELVKNQEESIKDPEEQAKNPEAAVKYQEQSFKNKDMLRIPNKEPNKDQEESVKDQDIPRIPDEEPIKNQEQSRKLNNEDSIKIPLRQIIHNEDSLKNPDFPLKQNNENLELIKRHFPTLSSNEVRNLDSILRPNRIEGNPRRSIISNEVRNYRRPQLMIPNKNNNFKQQYLMDKTNDQINEELPKRNFMHFD